MKIFSSLFWRHVKTAIFVSLIVLTTVLAAAWTYSYHAGLEWTHTGATDTYHLASKNGNLGVVVFSNTAEDEAYREYGVGYWLPTITALLATIFTGWRRARTGKKLPAFPVSQDS